MSGFSSIKDMELAEKILDVPVLTPCEMEHEMLSRGFRGQEYARRQLCMYAYRHVQRLRRLYILGKNVEDLPAREHMLCFGPSGSGKTYGVTLLLREILGLPTVVVDITQFTETGYYGQNVPDVLSDIYEAAEKDAVWASVGIVCIDEFDKIASQKSGNVFSGGSGKDVSGRGVQRELLNMLSGRSMQFTHTASMRGSMRGRNIQMSLEHLGFICCGAFTGLEQLRSEKCKGIGFNATPARSNDSGVHMQQADDIMEYGITTELMGRITHVVEFQALDQKVLSQILEDTIFPAYKSEFALEGLDIELTGRAAEFLCARAVEYKTGARGLRAGLGACLNRLAWNYFGSGRERVLEIDADNDDLVVSEDKPVLYKNKETNIERLY